MEEKSIKAKTEKKPVKKSAPKATKKEKPKAEKKTENLQMNLLDVEVSVAPAGEHKKRLATDKNPYIEPILTGLTLFNDKDQAIEKLASLKEFFIVSAKPEKGEDEHTVKIWIRNFELTEDETKKGFLGNYALIKLTKTEDKKFTLKAEKQAVELKYHPQRVRQKRKHPDWGHPCMRLIKKENIFPNIEDAQKVLNQLFEEYPNISIQAPNKLYIILYSKIYNPPIKKFILEITSGKEGGFLIKASENNFEKSAEPKVFDDKKFAKKPNSEKENKGFSTPKFADHKSNKKVKKDFKKPTTAKKLPTIASSGSFSNRISIPLINNEE